MVLDIELILRALALLAHARLIALVLVPPALRAGSGGLLAGLILLAAADGLGAHLLLASLLETTGVAAAKGVAGAIVLGTASLCALRALRPETSAPTHRGAVALGLILTLGAVSMAGDLLRISMVLEEATEIALVLVAGTAMRRLGERPALLPSRGRWMRLVLRQWALPISGDRTVQ